MAKPPLIGLSLDCEPGGNWSPMPWYAIRQNYAEAVAAAGGLPLLLPHEPDFAQAYAEALDGLIVTGGNFDVDPALFGAAVRHASVTTKDRRTAFEMAISRAMLARDKPVFGICGGEQLLAVLFGGTLIQHIPDDWPGALVHEQTTPKTQPAHSVQPVAGTKLAAITGAAPFAVNTTHHQAVATVAGGLVVNAHAPDGLIEGIEHPGHRFCLGVQWHPEYHAGAGDRPLFAALIEACQ